MTISPKVGMWISIAAAIISVLVLCGAEFTTLFGSIATSKILAALGIINAVINGLNGLLHMIPSQSTPAAMKQFWLGPVVGPNAPPPAALKLHPLTVVAAALIFGGSSISQLPDPLDVLAYFLILAAILALLVLAVVATVLAFRYYRDWKVARTSSNQGDTMNSHTRRHLFSLAAGAAVMPLGLAACTTAQVTSFESEWATVAGDIQAAVAEASTYVPTIESIAETAASLFGPVYVTAVQVGSAAFNAVVAALVNIVNNLTPPASARLRATLRASSPSAPVVIGTTKNGVVVTGWAK